jgi:hypothetical protein
LFDPHLCAEALKYFWVGFHPIVFAARPANLMVAKKHFPSQSKQMKFLIQDCQTAEFMRCDSSWGVDINEAFDFLSERRAFLFGMKDLKNSFKIIKVALEAPFPAFIRLILSPGSQTSIRATKHPCEQAPLMRRMQTSVLELRKRLPGLGEVSRLNLL